MQSLAVYRPCCTPRSCCFVEPRHSLHYRFCSSLKGSAKRARNDEVSVATPRMMTLMTESSFAQALTERSLHIEKSSTDDLVEMVRGMLKDGKEVDKEMLEEMVVHLGDVRGMSRLQLVELFGEIGGKSVGVLVDGLKGCGNPVVRRSCGKALAKIRDPRAVAPLIDAMVNDEDTVARASAAGALARVGDAAVNALLEVVRDVDVEMVAKGHAAWALAFMGGDVGERLFELVRDRNKDVRIAIVGAIGSLAIGDALPAMGAAAELEVDDWIEDEDGERKVELRQRAVAVLRERLQDEDVSVRAEAATALANAGDSDSVGDIAGLLEDDDAEMRRAAALALMKMSDSSVIDALNRRADDENEVETVRGVAKLAATTLARSAASDDNGW